MDKASLRQVIEKYGWAVIGVADEERPFAYSVGAAGLNIPDVIIIGLNVQVSTILVNKFLEHIRDCKDIIDETKSYSWLANMPVCVRKVKPECKLELAILARNHYDRDDFELYQIVYPDPEGLFPWEEGYNFDNQRLLF